MHLQQELGSNHRFTAEASDVGFHPGQWPAVFERDDVRWRISRLVRDDDGEIYYAIYIADPNLTLKVFND